MKSIFFSAILTFCFPLFSNAQVLTDCESEGTLLGYNDMVKFSRQYKENYENSSRPILGNSFAYYIDSRAVIFMAKALQEIKEGGLQKYNGVNINFVSHANKLSTDGFRYQSRISISAANLKEESGKKVIYQEEDAFLNFYNSLTPDLKQKFDRKEINRGINCKGRCDTKIDEWLELNISNSRILKDKISGLGNHQNPIQLLFANKDEIKKSGDRYKSQRGSEIRTGQYPSGQTRSSFFNDFQIIGLGDFLDVNIGSHPVCAIYFLNYDTNLAEGQIDPKQNTLVIVPMTIENGYLVPDPCSYSFYIQKTYSNQNIKANLTMAGGENHGTLCPSICPPGEGQ
jgi:hypothetical protein